MKRATLFHPFLFALVLPAAGVIFASQLSQDSAGPRPSPQVQDKVPAPVVAGKSGPQGPTVAARPIQDGTSNTLQTGGPQGSTVPTKPIKDGTSNTLQTGGAQGPTVATKPLHDDSVGAGVASQTGQDAAKRAESAKQGVWDDTDITHVKAGHKPAKGPKAGPKPRTSTKKMTGRFR